MQKRLFIPLLATFAATLSGCQNLPFFGGGGETASEPTAVQSVPVKRKPKAAPQTAPSPQKTVTLNQPSVAAGLIASTDPNKRENEIKPRNSDPFSAFPARATVKQLPASEEAKKVAKAPGRSVPPLPVLPPIDQPPRFPGLPRFPRPPVPVPAGSVPGGGGQQTARGPGGVAQAPLTGRSVPELPKLPPIPKPPSAGATGKGSASGQKPGAAGGGAGAPGLNPPQLPKAPDPTTAKGVRVTGVIEIRGVPHAIVQAPGQESRYVKAGDYLANGQVLVKRIQTNKGGTPVVVLEEKGVEVVRRVGEGGETAAAPASAPSPQGATPQVAPSPNASSEG